MQRIERGLNRDWIHGDKVISGNELFSICGSHHKHEYRNGVPVTVRYTEKDGKIPPCDFVSKRNSLKMNLKHKEKMLPCVRRVDSRSN